ncbi:MAG: hypothetical protein D6805_00115 [Planctomycetota bacterium]|nr:MAG: hypothetical protein D6805_00115 [Planctomycetota bacterium]
MVIFRYIRRIRFGFVGLVFVWMVGMVSILGAKEKLKDPLADAKKGESCTYAVEVSSKFGKAVAEMLLKVVRPSFTSIEVSRVTKWKGRKYVLDTKYPTNKDLLARIQAHLKYSDRKERGWEKFQVKQLKVEKKEVSLKDLGMPFVSKQVVLVRRRGATDYTYLPNQPAPVKKYRFRCYVITLQVEGEYFESRKPSPEMIKYGSARKNAAKKAKLSAKYWISYEVPVLGILKMESTVSKEVLGTLYTATVVMRLKSYDEIQVKK